MYESKHKYRFKGSVRCFDEIVARDWVGETWAVSEKKAKSQLEYRYKIDHGYTANCRITLVGKFEVIR